MGLDRLRFFISHKETDQAIAECTVNIILESFYVSPDDVFCSSVSGHALQFGQNIASQIKSELQDGDVLFALLTLDSVRSTWVLFELGAAWALDRLTIPILGPGVSYKDLPGALTDYPCISMDEPEVKVRGRLEDAFKQISDRHSITRKSGGRFVTAMENWIKAFKQYKPTADIVFPPIQLFPNGYEIHQTIAGGRILRSCSEPYNYLCPTCYGTKKAQIFLQGNYNTSTTLVCPNCKAFYPAQPRHGPSFAVAKRPYKFV